MRRENMFCLLVALAPVLTHWTTVACAQGIAVELPRPPPMGSPLALTTSAQGDEDTIVPVQLRGTVRGNPSAVLEFVVTTLPPVGTLVQADGTPIASVPTLVTDSGGGVRYTPPPNANGAPLTSFAYSARIVGTGRVSAPQAVQVTILPVNDPPVWHPLTVTTNEDTPVTFQVPVTDADLPNDTLTFRCIFTPSSGLLYQVGLDGAPILSPNIHPGDLITNPAGWVCYVPALNAFGSPVTTCTFSITDAHGANDGGTMPVVVQPVNDAPWATARTHNGFNSVPIVDVMLAAGDIDTPLSSLQICIDRLPATGSFYRGSRLITQVPDWGPFGSFRYRFPDALSGDGCEVPPPSFPSGFPYLDTFQYHVFDGELSSPVVTDTLNVIYVNTPPYYTGPTQVVVGEEQSVDFQLTGADIDPGIQNHPRFRIVGALPTHGTLFFGPDPVYTTPTDLIGSAPHLQFVASPQSGGHTDVLHIQVRDSWATRNCDYTVQFTIDNTINDAPTITGGGDFAAGVRCGVPLYDAVITTFSIADSDAGDGLLQVTLTGNGGGVGSLTLESTAGLATFEQVSATQVRCQGALSVLNAVLLQGVRYHPNGEDINGTVTIRVDDQGHSSSEDPPVNRTAERTVYVALDMELDC